MLSRTKSLMPACWESLRSYMRMNRDDFDSDDDASNSLLDDPLFWERDIEKHFIGDFSFAVVQANAVLEDFSHVDTGRNATFVGVYDGHGGPLASRYISGHFFNNLIRLIKDNGNMSEDVLKNAFSATEDGFLSHVRRCCGIQPLIQAAGSCCLVGLIWEGTLYVANVGDSRAVIASSNRSNKIIAEQLNKEHNANKEEVREELWSLHPYDPDVVVWKNGAWRIKGIIQESARRLVKKALKRAARRGSKKYEEMKYIEKGDRRALHDDITVVVIFTDHELLERKVAVPDLSIHGSVNIGVPSKFSILRDL